MNRDTPPERPLRWLGALIGLAVASVDAFAARAAGLTFGAGAFDATWILWLYLALNLGGLGFVVGWLVELRRRERRQAEALAEARARLARNSTLAALGQLAGTVAHEVRNPLAVIRSMVQTAREDAADGEGPAVDEGLGVALDEIDRLDRVIDGVLALARPPTPRLQVVSAGELLRRAGDLGARLVADRGLSLRVQAGGGAVAADGDLICQALLDLVANAASVAPAGSVIELAAAREGEAMALSVSDAGPGVPVELRGQIFEPFFTTRAGGTGLGLAVVRQITRAHGGRVEVGDGPAGGARFALVLPVADVPADALPMEAAA